MHDVDGRGADSLPRITIAPEPADDELAALAVALAALLDERDAAPLRAPGVPSWAAAGRREAAQGNAVAGNRGWARLPFRR